MAVAAGTRRPITRMPELRSSRSVDQDDAQRATANTGKVVERELGEVGLGNLVIHRNRVDDQLVHFGLRRYEGL